MADNRMSSRARWAVPAVALVAVVGVFAGPTLFASAAGHELPATTPEQLVAAVAAAPTPALSGTVEYTARLGLPSLPFESEGADPANLLTGSSTLRVWTDGQERSRVSLIGPMSEYSVIADGPQAWTYSSSKDAVVHWTLDAAARQRYQAAHDAAGSDLVAPRLPTPTELATQVLAQARRYATVTLDDQARVAGRDAYQLVVTPKDDGTLVDRVVVAVDATTSTPLRVQVWSTRNVQHPALEVGFTSVSFGTPPSSVLSFTPPAGATVREKVVSLPDRPERAPSSLPSGVTVHGSGWSTVVERSGVDVGALLAGLAPTGRGPHPTIGSSSGQGLVDQLGPGAGGDPSSLLGALTTAVPQGRLLTSALFSVLVTNDGRVLAGLVPPATLEGLA